MAQIKVLESGYFEKHQSKAERLNGEEAIRSLEQHLHALGIVMDTLAIVNNDHPFLKPIGEKDYVEGISYYDGTFRFRVNENDGNHQEIIFWGSQGPAGMKARIEYENVQPKKSSKHMAVLTEGNQLVGMVQANERRMSVYQYDLNRE